MSENLVDVVHAKAMEARTLTMDVREGLLSLARSHRNVIPPAAFTAGACAEMATKLAQVYDALVCITAERDAVVGSTEIEQLAGAVADFDATAMADSRDSEAATDGLADAARRVVQQWTAANGVEER